MKKQMQVVVITLKDGRKATFTGPLQFKESDSAYIESIQSYLTDLPEDCIFGPLFEEKDGQVH